LLILLACSVRMSSAEEFERVGTFAYGWEGFFTGVRSEALGDADLAAGALLLNPAAVVDTDGVEAEYGHLGGLEDIDIDNVGVSAAWRGWRVAAVTSGFAVETTVRTAYEPEGNGTLFELQDRVTAIGVSYDLARLLSRDTGLRLALGAAYRRYHTESWQGGVAWDADANMLDVGATLGWGHAAPGTRFTVEASFARQNLTEEIIDVDDVWSRLPEVWRCGLTAEVALDLGGEAAAGLTLRGAVASSEDQSRDHKADHAGFEAVFLDLLAMRVGHDSDVYGGTTGYGLALILDQAWLHPVGLTVEWTHLDIDPALSDDLDMVGVRGRLAL